MSEVKQEGDFKMKAKPKRPKNLGKKNEITKVDLSKPSEENQGEVIPNVTKVEIKEPVVEQVVEHKHLGIWLTPTLCWSRHIQHICMKANSKLAVLRSVKYLSRTVLDILYKLQIRSVIDYGLTIL